MWMVLVPLMEAQDSTSGPLLQLAGGAQYVPVAHHNVQMLLGKISFVTQGIQNLAAQLLLSNFLC